MIRVTASRAMESPTDRSHWRLALLLPFLLATACARPTGRFEFVRIDSAAEQRSLQYGV